MPALTIRPIPTEDFDMMTRSIAGAVARATGLAIAGFSPPAQAQTAVVAKTPHATPASVEALKFWSSRIQASRKDGKSFYQLLADEMREDRASKSHTMWHLGYAPRHGKSQITVTLAFFRSHPEREGAIKLYGRDGSARNPPSTTRRKS